MTVVTVHLSFVPGRNALQLRRVARWAGQFPAPRLLLGDLNLPGRLPARITGWRQLARTATYPSYRPRVQFDHLLASGSCGIRASQVQAMRTTVSDHSALCVDLELAT
jgi:endonuclease/exonuclease/phosphatase family metal-dependent hydrolase